MNKNFLLSLLVTSTIVAGAAIADELPEAKKPSTMLGGCKASLIADSKALSKESNIANALWCVEQMANDPTFKKKNPNFQNQLKTGGLQDALETNYADASELEATLANVEKASATGSVKEELTIRKEKSDAKKSAEKSKNQMKMAEKVALKAMLEKLQEEDGLNSLAENSNIELLEDELDNYGNADVSQEAKKPFNTALTEAKASEQKLGNLGYMTAAIAKLQDKGAKNIPENPKFIKAAAASVEDFWSQSECYEDLDEAGYRQVAKLVRDVAVVKGALDLYEKTLKENKHSGNKNKNKAERNVDKARAKLKKKPSTEMKGERPTGNQQEESEMLDS